MDNDLTKTLFGVNAVHVPAWLYIQDQSDGVVTFTGASRIQESEHPLRYGSKRTHQFVVGEIVVRPHLVLATDTLRGTGIAGLINGNHDLDQMLSDGEYVIGSV